MVSDLDTRFLLEGPAFKQRNCFHNSLCPENYILHQMSFFTHFLFWKFSWCRPFILKNILSQFGFFIEIWALRQKQFCYLSAYFFLYNNFMYIFLTLVTPLITSFLCLFYCLPSCLFFVCLFVCLFMFTFLSLSFCRCFVESFSLLFSWGSYMDPAFFSRVGSGSCFIFGGGRIRWISTRIRNSGSEK